MAGCGIHTTCLPFLNGLRTSLFIYSLCLIVFMGISTEMSTALLVGRSPDRFLVVSLGIFSVVLQTEPCALRSTQPLKVSTRDFSWGKDGRCVWLTTIIIFMEITSDMSTALLVGRSRDRFPLVSVGIFSVVPPTEPCVLRSTQPLKVSTRDFSWGKWGRCVWLTIYHPCSAETSRKSGALIYPETLRPPRPVAGGHNFFIFF